MVHILVHIFSLICNHIIVHIYNQCVFDPAVFDYGICHLSHIPFVTYSAVCHIFRHIIVHIFVTYSAIRHSISFHISPFRTITYHSILYHSIPYHFAIPYHIIPCVFCHSVLRWREPRYHRGNLGRFRLCAWQGTPIRVRVRVEPRSALSMCLTRNSFPDSASIPHLWPWFVTLTYDPDLWPWPWPMTYDVLSLILFDKPLTLTYGPDPNLWPWHDPDPDRCLWPLALI